MGSTWTRKSWLSQTRITERSDRERPIPKVNYGASIWGETVYATTKARLAWHSGKSRVRGQ